MFARFRRRILNELSRDLRAEIELIRQEWERELPAKRLEQIEAALADLEDRHQELHRSHSRLRARQGMREARAAQGNGHAVTLEDLERKHGLRK